MSPLEIYGWMLFGWIAGNAIWYAITQFLLRFDNGETYGAYSKHPQTKWPDQR